MANISISNFNPSALREESGRGSDPNAAPLEQNVKNLECGGVLYKVVKEKALPWQINSNPISPSRKDAQRQMEKEMGYRKSKKQAADPNAFAISASNCAALEEVLANERDDKAKLDHEDFVNHTKHKVKL